ncbi:unnamed protein product [Ectocarpus sp. CCAP 1310/34]|nr:unnamed protein product [Ectocarpus sp. CCAP 1310/34]
MSESDGGGGTQHGGGGRKRANSSSTGGRNSPSPPRNASVSSASGASVTSAPSPAPASAPGPTSKKKQKKGSRGSSTGSQAYTPPASGVVISRSAEDCAPQLTMPHKDQLTVTGHKGFRMARATKGVSNGTWYWECTVLPPETTEGHCRLGWSLPAGKLQGPVGYDKFSYAYRDIAGSKVHDSLRSDNYGEPWGPGDVIGFLIKLKSPTPEEIIDTVGASSDSGRNGMTAAAAAAALAAGQSPSELAATAASDTAAGDPFNEIRFFKNGRDQGVAYSAMKPGTYFPAVSLYMGGSVRVNFGPDFVYPPPRSLGYKPVAALRPYSKDEMKSQRKETKRERAARGLETTTRQTGGAPPLPSLSGSTTNNVTGNSASTAGASTAASAINNNPSTPASVSSREGDESEGRASPPPPADAGGEGDKRLEARDSAGDGKTTTPSISSSPTGKGAEGEVVGSEKAAAVMLPRKDEGCPEGRKEKDGEETSEKGGEEARGKVFKAEAATSADGQRGGGGGSSPMEVEGKGVEGEGKATILNKEPRSATALVRNSDAGERSEGNTMRKTGGAKEPSSATATAAVAAVSGKEAASPMDIDGEKDGEKNN